MVTKQSKGNLRDERHGEIKGSTLYAESKVPVFSVITALLTMTTSYWSLSGTLAWYLREILSYRANPHRQPDFAQLVVFPSKTAENSAGLPESRKFQGGLANQSDSHLVINCLPVLQS